MKTKILIGLTSIIISLDALAQCSGIQCANVTIKAMQVNTTDENIWVATSGVETGLSCTANSGVYLLLDTSSPGGKNVYSTMLAYKMTNRPLNIRVAEGSNPCNILYVNPE